MTNHGGVLISDTAQDRPANVIEADGLTATYSTGCTPSGEWFALGTIARDAGVRTTPAWVVVGTGASSDEAVRSLTAEIRAQARSTA
jgi:hypothetical protein